MSNCRNLVYSTLLLMYSSYAFAQDFQLFETLAGFETQVFKVKAQGTLRTIEYPLFRVSIAAKKPVSSVRVSLGGIKKARILNLNDNGLNGDIKAGDNIYSSAIPSCIYEVDEISAADYCGIRDFSSASSESPLVNQELNNFETFGYHHGIGTASIDYSDSTKESISVRYGLLLDTFPEVSLQKIDDDVYYSANIINILDLNSSYIASSGFNSAKVANKFYEYFDDNFDYIVLRSDKQRVFPFSGIFNRVKNDIQGIGVPIFDNSALFGSASSLDGVITLNLNGHTIVLGHEIAHTWHHYLPIDASPHGGVNDYGSISVCRRNISGITRIGPTRYLVPSGCTDLDEPLHSFSLYLAGLVPDYQVSPITVLDGAKFTESAQGGEIYESAAGLRTYTVNDIVGLVGPRIPNFENSPKTFRIANVVVSREPISNTMATWYELQVNAFISKSEHPYTFFHMTDSRGTVISAPYASMLHPLKSEWPMLFSGTNPSLELALPLNNIGVFNAQDGLIYTCVAIARGGQPSAVNGVSKFDVGFTILSMDDGLLQIVKARPFNPTKARHPNGEEPTCSGKLDTSTNLYTDNIQVGEDTFSVSFKFTDSVRLKFQLDSLSPLTSNGVESGSSRFLSFPLECANISCTLRYSNGAYTLARINSVLDHAMKSVYAVDNVVLAFTGERGLGTNKSKCYPKEGGDSFSVRGLYQGTGSDNCLPHQGLNYDGHPGYDYHAETGVEVKSAAAGVVVKGRCIPKGISAGCAVWGYVGIDHGNGYVTQYGHLSSVYVSEGMSVGQGEVLGLSGQASPSYTDQNGIFHQYSVGEHLHFEVLKANTEASFGYSIVDPYGWEGDLIDDLLAKETGIKNIPLWKQEPAP